MLRFSVIFGGVLSLFGLASKANTKAFLKAAEPCARESHATVFEGISLFIDSNSVGIKASVMASRTEHKLSSADNASHSPLGTELLVHVIFELMVSSF